MGGARAPARHAVVPTHQIQATGTRHLPQRRAVKRLEDDVIAGHDGFHGVSCPLMPAPVRTEFEKVYPYGWFGILFRTPPVESELICAAHDRGFALDPMCNHMFSQLYFRVPLTDTVEDWSDAAFWTELKMRLPTDVVARLFTGLSIETSIALLRSFMTEPMRWGRLVMCGDAAHFVPPTKAKGQNIVALDVHYLFEYLVKFYRHNRATGIDAYSSRALACIGQAMRFFWSLSSMIHRFADASDHARWMQDADLAQLETNAMACVLMAESHMGLPDQTQTRPVWRASGLRLACVWHPSRHGARHLPHSGPGSTRCPTAGSTRSSGRNEW
jgi:p-hydroxybenzoate 3-monooxygenase